jgi:hypothetical protein
VRQHHGITSEKFHQIFCLLPIPRATTDFFVDVTAHVQTDDVCIRPMTRLQNSFIMFATVNATFVNNEHVVCKRAIILVTFLSRERVPPCIFRLGEKLVAPLIAVLYVDSRVVLRDLFFCRSGAREDAATVLRWVSVSQHPEALSSKRPC